MLYAIPDADADMFMCINRNARERGSNRSRFEERNDLVQIRRVAVSCIVLCEASRRQHVRRESDL